jgi:hypothetical protein
VDPHAAVGYIPPGPAPSGGHSGHWGLASLLTAGVVLIAVPLFLTAFVNGTNQLWNNPRFDEKAMKLVTLGSTAVVLALVALAVLAFLFGIAGIIAAMARGQPSGLPLAGTLVSLAAMVFAIVLMLATFRLADELQKNFDRKRGSGAQPTLPMMAFRAKLAYPGAALAKRRGIVVARPESSKGVLAWPIAISKPRVGGTP